MQECSTVAIETAENERAAKICRRDVADVRPAITRAEFNRVRAGGQGDVIPKLIFMTFERVVADLRSTTGKSIEHRHAGTWIRGLLLDEVPDILETEFIDYAGIHDCHVNHLQNVQSIGIIKRMRGEREPANTLFREILRVQEVSHTERVVLVQSKVKTRTEVHEFLGRHDRLADCQRIERSIQRGRVDDRGVVDVATIEVEKERSALGQWTTQIAFNSAPLIRRPIQGVRIARIEDCIAESKRGPSMKFARTGLGENLNVAEADSFELR